LGIPTALRLIDSFWEEDCRVGKVSVTDEFLERKLFALLTALEHQPRAVVRVDGVEEPLSEISYRLGKI
jgi:hypothetical protein